MKKYLLLALPLVAFAAPANAQVVPGGLRVELMTGFEKIDTGIDDEDFDDVELAGLAGDIDAAFYGGAIGFDFGSMPGIMLGADAEYTQSTGDRTIFSGPNEPAAELNFGRDLYVGGRATFAVSSRFNVYAKAGYTNLRVSLSPADEADDDFFDDEDFDTDDLDTNLDGVRGALGVSFAPEGRAYYGAELRYSNYENDVSRKQIAVVVGYKF